MAGLKVNGRVYEVPPSLRIGETRMIKKITGLNPPEFMEALQTLPQTQDPDVGLAMLWWIMHRENPSITVADLDELEWTDVEGDGDTPAAVDDPKAGGEPSASSPTSALAS